MSRLFEMCIQLPQFIILNWINCRSKLQNEEKYATSLNLKIPKSDLLTFGIIGRDYKKDKSALDELHLLVNDLGTQE